MEEQKKKTAKGATMRLGAYDCSIKKGSLAYSTYKKSTISERHRHRYEFNNKYKTVLSKKGLIISGVNPESNLVEMIEIKKHPWFVACQFHPEFKSKPMEPHPLFSQFIGHALKLRLQKNKKKVKRSLRSGVSQEIVV
jgi:CTP synthase